MVCLRLCVPYNCWRSFPPELITGKDDDNDDDNDGDDQMMMINTMMMIVEGRWLGQRKVGVYSWLRIHERPNLVLLAVAGYRRVTNALYYNWSLLNSTRSSWSNLLLTHQHQPLFQIKQFLSLFNEPKLYQPQHWFKADFTKPSVNAPLGCHLGLDLDTLGTIIYYFRTA